MDADFYDCPCGARLKRQVTGAGLGFDTRQQLGRHAKTKRHKVWRVRTKEVAALGLVEGETPRG